MFSTFESSISINALLTDLGITKRALVYVHSSKFRFSGDLALVKNFDKSSFSQIYSILMAVLNGLRNLWGSSRDLKYTWMLNKSTFSSGPCTESIIRGSNL